MTRTHHYSDNGRSKFGVHQLHSRIIFELAILVAGILSYLPVSAAPANQPALTSALDRQALVTANVATETRIKNLERNIFQDKLKRRPDFSAKAHEFGTCFLFSDITLYARFASLIDGMDTTPFEGPGDYRRDRYDNSTLRDPRSIAVEVKSLMSSVQFVKGYRPPLREFLLAKSRDGELRTLCRAYLDNH